MISVAAELAGMHPQTLRIYERKGLIEPARTSGRSRRYSERDIELLRRIQELSNDGVSLAGVNAILALEDELARGARSASPSSKRASTRCTRKWKRASKRVHQEYRRELVPVAHRRTVVRFRSPRR